MRISLLICILFVSFCIYGQDVASLKQKAEENYKEGKYPESALLYEQALKLDSSEAVIAYNAACSFALSDNKEKALRYLRLSVDAGWDNFDQMTWDNDLESLHSDPRWHMILAPGSEATAKKLDLSHRKLIFYYEAACSYALSGNKDKAFENLEHAIYNGWTGVFDDSQNADLVSLKSDPRWNELVKKFNTETQKTGRSYFWGMYFGILFILFFYNLFLFISLKDTSFLYYSLMIFSYSQFESIRTSEFGFFARDIFVWYPYFDLIVKPSFFFIGLVTLFHMLFTSNFLSLKETHPRRYKWLRGFIIYLILQCIITCFTGLNLRPFVYFSAMLAYVFTLFTAIACWRKGYRPARFFVLASFTSTVGLVLRILRSLTIIDVDFYLGVFGPDTLGVIASFALLSFALGDRINILKQEKENAQEKALEVLEEKVKERTEEVVRQKHEIEEKQKEIIDSIKYARRIQRALITNDNYIQKNIERLNP